MGGHAWSVTSEDAECERGRKSKIRARQSVENHESYTFYHSTFCLISTVRRTSAAQKSGSHPPPPPYTVVMDDCFEFIAAPTPSSSPLALHETPKNTQYDTRHSDDTYRYTSLPRAAPRASKRTQGDAGQGMTLKHSAVTERQTGHD